MKGPPASPVFTVHIAAAMLAAGASCENVTGLDEFEVETPSGSNLGGSGGSGGGETDGPSTGGSGGSVMPDGSVGGDGSIMPDISVGDGSGDASTDGSGCPPCPTGAECVGGTCVCPSGTVECDGACVDTETSAAHCGDCGLACGGECTAGKCIVSYPGYVVFAIDDAYVYSADSIPGVSGEVFATPLASGPKEYLAEGADVFARAIAVNATSVCWISKNGMWKVGINGGTPVKLAESDYPLGIAIDATTVYWTDAGEGVVYAVPLSGGSRAALATGLESPEAIAVDESRVYFTDTGAGTVMSVPIGGGTVTTHATGQNAPGAIAVNGTSLYWTTLEYEPDGKVMMVPLAGGTPTMIAGGYDVPRGIALDSTHVYWSSDYDGRIVKAPLGGGATTLVLQSHPNLYGVAVNATSLFWGTTQGIQRVTPK